MLWTKEKTDTLIDLYPNFGSRYCAKKLHLKSDQIASKARRLKIKLTKAGYNYVRIRQPHRTKAFHLLNVNPQQFIEPTTPEVSYLLGLLWADGFLGSNYSINLEVVSEDAQEFSPIFQKTGKWNTFHRQRGNHKPETKFTCSSKVMCEYFISQGFDEKSNGKSPCGLIQSIPKPLQHYWFRGYLDGDGCFYFNAKQYLRQLVFSSCYEQDWTFVETLFSKLEIQKWKVSNIKSKHSYSRLRCTNKADITRLGKYVYQDELFGLTRKKNKFLEISL